MGLIAGLFLTLTGLGVLFLILLNAALKIVNEAEERTSTIIFPIPLEFVTAFTKLLDRTQAQESGGITSLSAACSPIISPTQQGTLS